MDQKYNFNPGGGHSDEMDSGVSGGSVESGLAGQERLSGYLDELGMVPSGPNQAPSSPKGDKFK
jgi:hypothetical protein